MLLAAGDKLGPYEILAPIGAGGMGDVYKARDARLGRIVAVKAFKEGHGSRFQQEARAIAALNHPHICQIYDVGHDFLVMEYIEGKPLSGPLPSEDAVRIALQVAGALEAAHEKKILHRDLKPANILISRSGVKLLDFGLATMTSTANDDATAQTLGGVILGTAAYMSPEQAQGKQLDERSDIFSFGAVLYEMLSGKRAFAGDSMVDVLSAVVRDDPAPIESPAAVIVSRCLAKQPAQRFQSMAELKTALENVLTTKPAQSQPSIAVLPFANMSGDKDNEYFSDGLSEDIIDALVQIPGLKVAARTSAFAFRGKDQDIRRIAESLAVRTVLEGSVRKSGGRIRVTAQLINAADGYHLWSKRYDRELEDVFAVQDEIAAAIASALELKLAAAPERYQPNLQAWETYHKGQHQLLKHTREGLARAKDHFEQAIRLDPKFALAQSGVGFCILTTAMMGHAPAREVMPMVRDAEQKALEINPSLPEAHATLGIVSALHDYDWKEAERRFGIAMASEPVPVAVRLEYGSRYLLFSGRVHEAVAEFRRVLQEDPLSFLVRYWLGEGLWAIGRNEEALAEWDRALKWEDLFAVRNGVTMCHASNGRYGEALVSAEKALSISPPEDKIAPALLAGLLKRSGSDPARVQNLLNRLDNGRIYGAAIGFVLVHLLCDEVDLAADWLTKSIEERYPGTLFFAQAPLAKPLRESPRWPALAKMMNLREVVA